MICVAAIQSDIDIKLLCLRIVAVRDVILAAFVFRNQRLETKLNVPVIWSYEGASRIA